MSAIAGIYRRDQQEVGSDELYKMTKILAHRGPDGFDIWCDDSVGLAHRMLHSTPESLLEQLPFSQSGLTITADARIDNRNELISQLCLGNRPLEKITDSEVILAAYAKWEERCPEELLGDFSFAIWDSRKQHLFCARDHFGIKPFYYYADKTCLVFSTEIKALFCVENVPRHLNRLRMADYLTSMFHDVKMTSYQKIFRLPPAHKMTVSCKGLEIASYWCLDPSRTLPPASNQEYASRLKEIFAEAVNCRLRSAYPIGSTLSGGLDSSSITCVARNLLSQREQVTLHTFSSVFDNMPECDEREYTQSIFDQGGVCPHFVQGNHQTPLENLEEMFWYQDEAFYAPNWFMSWSLYKEVKKQGIRVLLDGFDGDNAVSEGYGLISELAEDGRWQELIRQIWKLSEVSDFPFWRGLWAYFYHYRLRLVVERYWGLRVVRRVIHKISHVIFDNKMEDVKNRWDILLNLSFSEEMNMTERYREWRKTQGHHGLSERERHYRNIKMQGVGSFALEKMDRAMAAFTIEPRYPFWDKRLIEFCLALPAEQKLHDGHTRVVMRRAMSGILPPKVQWRQGKTDFSPNVTKGLLRNLPALSEALDSLSFAEHYINRNAFNMIYQKLLEEPSDQLSRKLWVGLSLALWIRYAFGEEAKDDNNRLISSTSTEN